MLTIKEAGRYANFLENLLKNVTSAIYYPGTYTKTTETHLRSKSNQEAEDEVIEVKINRVFETQAHNIAYLAQSIIEEKLKVAQAIEAAKVKTSIGWKENNIELTIDTGVEYAKLLRSFAAGTLQRLNNVKDAESEKVGYGQKFNAEGNQVNYSYKVTIKTEVDFDKKVIRELYKKDLEKADKLSTLIDTALTVESVDITPKFDIHDTAEEIIATYEANLK